MEKLKSNTKRDMNILICQRIAYNVNAKLDILYVIPFSLDMIYSCEWLKIAYQYKDVMPYLRPMDDVTIHCTVNNLAIGVLIVFHFVLDLNFE